jgi:uncharacterized RDD family membrane protein YckC
VACVSVNGLAFEFAIGFDMIAQMMVCLCGSGAYICRRRCYHISRSNSIMSRIQIDIPTPQNVIISYSLATFGERLLAMVIDIVIFFTAFWILLLIVIAIKSDGLIVFFLSMSPVLFLTYFFLQEVLNKGRTIGKRALNIMVVKTDGSVLKWSEMILRAACLIPDLLFSGGVIGSAMINTHQKRQRLGDIAAGTYVIKSVGSNSMIFLQDLLSIQTISSYTPKFEQVRQLTEKDMIFIKTVIQRAEKYANTAHYNAVLDLSEHLRERLGIEQVPQNRIEFLKTLLKDYVVMTR